MFFLRKFKNITKGLYKVKQNVQLQLDVTKSQGINFTHLELYFSLIIFALNPNSKNVHFRWKRMNLTYLILDNNYD